MSAKSGRLPRQTTNIYECGIRNGWKKNLLLLHFVSTFLNPLTFVQTSSTRFGQDFEVEVQARFEVGVWSVFCCWCFIFMYIYVLYLYLYKIVFELVIWLKISYFGKPNSTLGSTVPLSMFWNNLYFRDFFDEFFLYKTIGDGSITLDFITTFPSKRQKITIFFLKKVLSILETADSILNTVYTLYNIQYYCENRLLAYDILDDRYSQPWSKQLFFRAR